MAACLEEMVESDELRQDNALQKWERGHDGRWLSAVGAAHGVLDEIASRGLSDLVHQARSAVALLREHARRARIDPFEQLRIDAAAAIGPPRPSRGLVSLSDVRSMATAASTGLRLRADEIEAGSAPVAGEDNSDPAVSWWPRIRTALLGATGWMRFDAICERIRAEPAQRAAVGAELSRRKLRTPPHVESRKVADQGSRNEYRLTAAGKQLPANASSTE